MSLRLVFIEVQDPFESFIWADKTYYLFICLHHSFFCELSYTFGSLSIPFQRTLLCPFYTKPKELFGAPTISSTITLFLGLGYFAR